MNRSFWHSLRTRIVLLAIVACAFLAIAAGSLYSFLSTSHTSTVRAAERRLSGVAAGMVQAYTSQAASGTSLTQVGSILRVPLPPSPPHPGPRGELPGPPPPPPADPLAKITAMALQQEDGVEGGFMAGTGPLVGYAFPTHEGPGPQKEMPQRERPTIDHLAYQAVSTGAAQSLAFEGPHDVVLFYAEPIREPVSGQTRVTGAVWLMQRLPDLNRGRSRQLLLATLGFGAAALITALLAWFLTVEIRGGVNAVTHHLAVLELDLSHAGRVREKPQLTEFERLLTGVDTMATSLRSRIENERRLEDQLRHKERLSSLGQFAAGVAHELRNPLATIRLRAQMAQQASAESAIARSSSVILEEVDRLDAMIGRLLNFSRPISLSSQIIDLGELCSAVAASWQQRAPSGVSITCDAAQGSLVWGDRSRLLQVLDNVMENAVQASQSGAGQVMLDVTDLGTSVQVHVIDSGPGFSAEALTHAFDPFFTTKDSGTGLGLSIAFELVGAHGGQIHLATKPEGGAVVSVVFPGAHAGQEHAS